MKFFNNTKKLFMLSTSAVVTSPFSAPEKKGGKDLFKPSCDEAQNKGEKARFEKIMTDASNKAFEHIRLFAVKQHLPGISVAVALNDDDPFVQCYGYSDVENLAPMLPATKVRVGGLSEVFTALLLLKRAACDDLDGLLKKKVFEYTSLPGAFSGITVRDCLLHQTGLDPIDRKTITNEAPLKKLVENVFDEIGDFIPVKEENYKTSEYNYLIISSLYESCFGKKSDTIPTTFNKDLVSLFKDFDLRNTRLEDYSMRINGMANHYRKKHPVGMGLEKVGHTNFTHRFGAMGVLSTSQDLAIFGRKIVQGSQNLKGSSGIKSKLIKNAFYYYHPGKSHSGKGANGRTRLGFHQAAGFKLLDTLPFNGVDEPEADMPVFRDGSDYGASSLLLMRGCHVTRAAKTPCKKNKSATKLDGTAVGIVTNLEGVDLFPLADRVADIYEQAYKMFEDEKMERQKNSF